MLTIDEIRKITLSLPAAEEIQHFEKPSFRVNQKIFVVIQTDMKTITVKTSREERALYIETDPTAYSVPESFSNLNYMHINLETANDVEVVKLIQSAWGRVAPKKLSKAFFSEVDRGTR